MKIIAVADIHGRYAAVDDILAREREFDLLLIAGDLTNVGTPTEAEAAILSFQRYGKPVLAVAGNMDVPAVESRFAGLRADINGRGVVIGDVGILGVAGSPPTPFRSPYELPEDEIAKRLDAGWAAIAGARTRIIVPHAPPHRTKLDRTFIGMHVGSKAVREFVLQRRPELLVCGHIHESRGIDTLGETTMVNCGQGGKGEYAVLEIGETCQVENRG